MNGTLVIAARELRERARIFAICAGLAALPFLAAQLPIARENRTDVIAVFGGFMAIIIGLGLAVALGASTIGRELTEKRMSFYFAKPVAPAAIWFGNASAALAISLGCFAIIAVPAYLASPNSWRLHWLGNAAPLAVGAVMIVEIFLVSHVLSTALRSRSALVALDLVCVVAALAALFFIVRPVILGGSGQITQWILVGVAVAASVILAVAPVWQLAHGRTDPRRGHAALSRFVWIGVAAVLLVAAGYVAWVVSVDPEDLREVFSVEQPARGSTALVSGHSAGRPEYAATFLVDHRTGASTHLPVPPWWGGRFSDDGRMFFWLQPSGLMNVNRLELYATHVGRGENVRTGITLTPGASVVVPSHDGSRVAIVDRKIASIYDLATGRLLVSGGGLDSNLNHGVFFITNDVVRVVEYNNRAITAAVRVFELDSRARTMHKTGEHTFELATGRGVSVSASADGTRMLVRGANVVVDGRTAEVLAQLPIETAPHGSAMLHDGSVASITRGAPRLRIFSRDGQLRHEIAIAGMRRAFVAGEIEGGKLLLIGTTATSTNATGKGRTMFVVDTARGVIERAVRDVKGPMPQRHDARLARFATGQQMVAVDAHGRLVTWDPRTGTVQPLKSAS